MIDKGLLLRSLSITALIVLLGFLTIYPLGMLMYGSLHSTPPGTPGEFNLAGYAQLLNARTLGVFADTLWLSLLKTIPSLLVAILLAWIVARTDTPYKQVMDVLITLPFFIPPVLTAMAWGMLANPQVGVINTAWRALTGSPDPLFNVYSYGGVVWHMVQYSIPFLYILTVDAFRAMDPAMEESSRMSGASAWTTMRRITLALMLPVISSVFILSFIRGVEAFESALFFGTPAGVEVVTTDIYHAIHHRATPDYQYATALSFMIMVVMFLLVVWQWRLLGGRSFQTVTGKAFQPRLMALGRWRWLTFGFVLLLFFVTVLLPVGQLLVGSFFRYYGFYSVDMLTLEHYRAVWNDRTFWRALANTAWLGFAGATATMVLGGLVAYIVVRTRWKVRRLVDALAWLPWMMPGIVLGVGFLWGFALLPGPIDVYGTLTALFLAYLTLGTPLATRVMTSSFSQLAFDLEECSRVHGASFLQTLRLILLALVWPAFAVGWVLTFFMILRELSASILLYSVGSEVLSVVVLRLWEDGRTEQVSVMALLMLVIVIVFRAIQLLLVRRQYGRAA